MSDMEGPSSPRRVCPKLADRTGISDEGRSERARAANEFQIVEDLQAALAQFAEIANDLKR
jgi:hypothetical protein